jgi:hypothetical protein
MTADEIIARESRVLPRQAVIAGAAGVLLLVSAILQFTGPHTTINELTLGLIYANKRYVTDITAAVLNGLALLCVAATLVFLFNATNARNPGVQPYMRWLALVGGVLAAISSVANTVVIAIKAHQFVTQGDQTYVQANHLTSTGILTALQYGNLLGALLVAMSLVLIGLGAMRVGLLTRFMGYLGIFSGILLIFPLVQVPVVEAYWLLALAYLFTGRWPSGVPPAWSSGKAEKWPSAAEMREERMRARGGPPLRPKKPAPAPAPEPVPAGPATRTRASTPKRKRKRRK